MHYVVMAEDVFIPLFIMGGIAVLAGALLFVSWLLDPFKSDF